MPFALVVGKRLRGDFAAVGLLVTAVMFNLLVTNYKPLLNGAAGALARARTAAGRDQPAGGRLSVGLRVVALILAFLTYRFVAA